MDITGHTSRVFMLALLLGSWARQIESANLPESVSVNNKTLTFGVLAAYYHWGYRYLPAIVPALERVEELQLLPGYQIQWTWRETFCQPDYGFRSAIQLWEGVEDLDAMIGPACDTVCQSVALLTAAWNIPTISPTCVSSSLSDVSQYPTFARTILTDISVAPAPLHIMQTFNWDRCVITATSQPLQTTLAKETERLLTAAGYTVFYHITNQIYFGLQVDEDAITEMRDLVKTIKDEALFIINYMNYQDRRVFLILAEEEGMINGEYIFYGTGDNSDIDLYRPEVDLEELIVGFMVSEPISGVGPVWDQLVDDMMEAYDDPHFIGQKQVSSEEEFQTFAATTYDAVLLWAYAVNQTLEQGGEPDDGMAVTENMYNFTFDGLLQPAIIDEKGDRKVDFFIVSIQPNLQFVPMFHWHAANNWLEKVYLPNLTDDWSGLYWSGGSESVPSGDPACGWEGEFCVEEEDRNDELTITVSSLGVAAITLMVVLVAVYRRHVKRQQEAESRRCLLTLSEIRLLSTTPNKMAASDGGPLAAETTSLISGFAEIGGNDDISLVPGRMMRGHVRDTDAAIRVYANPITKLERILPEITRMRQMAHVNLNSMIGVCVTPQETVVVMEYAVKGSLYDLINESSIKLTTDIQMPFLADIARGLNCLHTRMEMFHGHLTSTNCVMNSRWICKITDYGLMEVRQRDLVSSTLSDDAKLWTAPEILRQETQCSREGDIYSFGIIIQEVITNTKPYGCNTPSLTSSEIIANVKAGSDPHHRPHMDPNKHPVEWINLAERCWQGDPASRPNSRKVLQHIVDLNGGKLPNLVSSVIKNLEHHTRILEDIVEERSEQVRHEQAVMDTILRELLPESVANELKQGKQVEPEAFDDVTFFFSDIVGFTRVSAQSTPMQIVKMLNTLYSRFDKVIGKYDVYKVATIGDAYVVSSGAPIRNGDQHASEIAAMSLDMLVLVEKFSITHLPEERLYMRIGLHTGPCVAAVTGIKTPRYLFFGETVDMGARIEAGGEKMRVHMSISTAEILQRYSEFETEYRGLMEVKGVGRIETYWLLKRKGDSD